MLLCIHDHHDARSMIARAILAPKQLQKVLFCHMETGFVGAVRLVKAGIPEPHSNSHFNYAHGLAMQAWYD